MCACICVAQCTHVHVAYLCQANAWMSSPPLWEECLDSFFALWLFALPPTQHQLAYPPHRYTEHKCVCTGVRLHNVTTIVFFHFSFTVSFLHHTKHDPTPFQALCMHSWLCGWRTTFAVHFSVGRCGAWRSPPVNLLRTHVPMCVGGALTSSSAYPVL